MAKHCDVCNQDYADELPVCPHCANAKKTQLASAPAEDRRTQLIDGPLTQHEMVVSPSDSALNWPNLVEDLPSEQLKIDSPSDADLLKHSAASELPHEEIVGELYAKEPTVPAADVTEADIEVVELAAAAPMPASAASDSAVDFGASPAELLEDGSGVILAAAPPSDSQVFVAELASDAGKVELVGDSGILLGEEDVAAAESAIPAGGDASAAAIEGTLDPNTPEAELTEQVALDAVLAEEHSSAVDLGAPAPADTEAVSVVAPEEDVHPTEGSTINLHGLPVPTGSSFRSGGRPLTESAVDLGSQQEIAPLSSSGESLEADEEATVAAADEPAISETEVNELLAGLEETPASGKDLAALAEEEAAVSDVAEGEEAVAEAEAEVSAEEQAVTEEEKPAKPVKPRSRVPSLVGGTVFGLLLGAGGVIGARGVGVDVPAMMGLGEQKKAAAPVVPPAPTPAATPNQRVAHVNNGDWEEAAKAGIEQIQESNPKERATRGSYRLGAYLHKKGAKVNPQDPDLQSAIADLENAAKANDPDAIYDLGLINELANKLKEARAEYNKGLQLSQNDPFQKRRFQSALDRLELRASDKAPGAAFLPLPERVEDRVALLALLLIGFQQPVQPATPAAPAQGDDEAGFDFWEAAKLARKGDFDKAIRAIDKARQTHDKRRFTRLRKAQNPLSDPTEDIFLRCCDELKQYWLMESHLRERNYLTDKNTPQKALQDLLKEAGASADTVKAVADKFIKEKIITRPEDVTKGVDRLIAEKTDAEKKAADLTTMLEKSTKEATDLAGKLKTAEESIKDRDVKLKAAGEQELKLKAANDDLSTTLKKIADQLAAAKFLDPKDKSDVGEAVRKAVDLAKSKDSQGLIRTQRNQLEQLTASLKQRRRPEEMLPLWRMLLEQNRSRGELAAQAAMDADRVKADPKATAGQNGQAQIVLGLALRNSEKFDQAKTVLQGARQAVDQAEWRMAADAALREVSNPAGYYASQAQKLYDRGQLSAALAVLDRAMNVLPAKDQVRLFAPRSLMELDAARSKSKGALPPTEPLLLAAKKDAAEAVKAGLAEGHYATGRIAEELGQWDAAIQSYRKALDAHKALDTEGNRYRIALARVLVQPREARQGTPAPAGGNKIGWRDPAPYPARHHDDLKQFVLMVTLGLQALGLPDDEAGMEEAEKLADEVLKAPANTVPFDVRAQALAIKGRWTPALQTYVDGIRLLLPREYGNGLQYLILNHPRLKRPDSLRIPNPADAEKHFAAGLNFYFDRDYANAEKEFLLTVENDSQDARYFYFLGLSRLSQSRRRDAKDDFDQGALLERLNRPAPAAVSESLERIQGPPRRIVNEIRNRPER